MENLTFTELRYIKYILEYLGDMESISDTMVMTAINLYLIDHGKCVRNISL